MFYQIFLPSQVKRCAIITYKHGTYEFPPELPNDLSLEDAHGMFADGRAECLHKKKDLESYGIRKYQESV